MDCLMMSMQPRASSDIVAQAHLAGAARDHEPEHPSLRSSVANLQIEAVTVTIEAGLKRLFGLQHGKLASCAAHIVPRVRNATHKSFSERIGLNGTCLD